MIKRLILSTFVTTWIGIFTVAIAFYLNSMAKEPCSTVGAVIAVWLITTFLTLCFLLMMVFTKLVED